MRSRSWALMRCEHAVARSASLGGGEGVGVLLDELLEAREAVRPRSPPRPPARRRARPRSASSSAKLRPRSATWDSALGGTEARSSSDTHHGSGSPTFTSLRPICAPPRRRTRWSAVRARMQPPATAWPLTAGHHRLGQAVERPHHLREQEHEALHGARGRARRGSRGRGRGRTASGGRRRAARRARGGPRPGRARPGSGRAPAARRWRCRAPCPGAARPPAPSCRCARCSCADVKPLSSKRPVCSRAAPAVDRPGGRRSRAWPSGGGPSRRWPGDTALPGRRASRTPSGRPRGSAGTPPPASVRNFSRVGERRNSTLVNMRRTPAAATRPSSRSRLASSSVRPGRTGARPRLVSMPASTSRRITSMRTSGGGAQGSSLRTSSACGETSETWTLRRERRWIFCSRSRSRRISAPLVTMPRRTLRWRATISRKRRVTLASALRRAGRDRWRCRGRSSRRRAPPRPAAARSPPRRPSSRRSSEWKSAPSMPMNSWV